MADDLSREASNNCAKQPSPLRAVHTIAELRRQKSNADQVDTNNIDDYSWSFYCFYLNRLVARSFLYQYQM